MRNWKSLFALVLALMMLAGILAGCSNNAQTPTDSPAPDTDAPPANVPETETPADDVYQMTGSVTIAYPEAEVAEIQPVLEAFRAQYPNIEVVEEPFPGSTGGAFNEFLTQKAAANDMPDLIR